MQASTNDPDGWRDLTDGAPLPEAVELDSAELLDELTHRVRGPLLRHLRTARSAAELAVELDVPVTRLYHHLQVLESAGMIEVVALRRVGSAQERRYRATARSYRVRDGGLDDPVDLARSLAAVVDLARSDLIGAVERGAGGDVDMWSLRLRLDPDEQRELTDRLRSLLDEFVLRSDDDDPNVGDGNRLQVVAMTFPLVD